MSKKLWKSLVQKRSNMFKPVKLELAKKNKYFIQSILVGIFIYIVTQNIIDLDPIQLLLLSFILVVSGSLISHSTGITKENFIYSIIMPLGVISGGILSLKFYPNLGSVFKIFVVMFFSGIYYFVSLADNIFLVVSDREEIIPLYRVAVTWSQILQVIVAIPLFAGIFKLNIITFSHSLIISSISFLFTYYQLWVYRFEPDAKKIEIGERFYICFLSFFIMFVTSLGVSFFPSEDFLRALFTSSVLLFVLNYISAHLKNEITRRIIIRHLLITVVFLILLIFFKP